VTEKTKNHSHKRTSRAWSTRAASACTSFPTSQAALPPAPSSATSATLQRTRSSSKERCNHACTLAITHTCTHLVTYSLPVAQTKLRNSNSDTDTFFNCHTAVFEFLAKQRTQFLYVSVSASVPVSDHPQCSILEQERNTDISGELIGSRRTSFCTVW